MSFYTSLTGLNAATAMLGVTSNNISNVGTTGFKRSRADFGDIFATSPLQKSSSTVGQGVSLKQVSQEFGQGNISFSSNALDLAVTGDGFFPLRSADGLQEVFTRNGSFLLNEQFNVVNSSGQRLMAATVDSTGSANVNERVVLTIPQKTSGDAKQTSLVSLGLNFPADAQVISDSFNRTNPATYNKSTAFTVYDNGGNGYLATIYYVKTANANQNVPFNKWQTYVFVGEDQVNASLVQSTDANNEKIYVDQYGRTAPYSEVKDELTTDKTQLFSLDELTNKKVSEPAEVSGVKIPEGTGLGQFDWIGGMDKADITALLTGPLMSVDIDQSNVPVEISLEALKTYGTTTDKITGDLIAEEMTNQLIKGFGVTRTSGTAPNIKTGEPRFGMSVVFDAVNKKFAIKSGTTGDTFSVSVTDISAEATRKLGMGTTYLAGITPPEVEHLFTPEEKPLYVATRGIVSEPAIALGSPPSINTATNFKVDAANNKFIVTVDGIKETFTLPADDYSIDDFTAALQNRINNMVEVRSDGITPREINGVKVTFDPDKKSI